jgi:L,D-peptidoglycan transpeptidase YkuD (ErfK/YbiS/YcfS/YnhG family)
MNVKYWLMLVMMGMVCLAGCGATASTSPLGDSRQLVLVVSDNWDATTATLQRYERANPRKPWAVVGQAIPVNLGRTGLAWGRGLHDDISWYAPAQPVVFMGPQKQEGDGKAPAGAFDLPLAFGYAPNTQDPQLPPRPLDGRWWTDDPHPSDLKLAYLWLEPNVYGVDDPKSRYYNSLVRLVDSGSAVSFHQAGRGPSYWVWTDTPKKDWTSSETMRREDGLYEWGVLVAHNMSPKPVPGAGSCIFMHVWRGPGKPTAGCTAMSRENMLALLGWLDAQKKPVLVQLPRQAYQQLARTWALPEIRNDAEKSGALQVRP